MAGKTFIKVRIGILDPEHRIAIGEAIYLYLYMLDRAEWKTGIIYDWRDEYAARDLGYHVQSVRGQRRKLEGKYINYFRKNGHGCIQIMKWEDPRKREDSRADKKTSDNKLSPASDNKLSPESQSSDNGGDSGGDRTLSHIPFNLRYQITDKNIDNDPVSHFKEITGINYAPRMLTDEHSCWKRTLEFMYNSGATDEIIQAAAKEHGGLFDPYSLIPYVSRLVKQVTP